MKGTGARPGFPVPRFWAAVLAFVVAGMGIAPAWGAPPADSTATWTLRILAQSDSRAELRPCT